MREGVELGQRGSVGDLITAIKGLSRPRRLESARVTSSLSNLYKVLRFYRQRFPDFY